ncbi:MAG: glutathione S-transferase family protein [Alphaproteobacteria bacterium]
MKLLGRATSGNVQKVIFLLEELGASYEREDYGKQFGNTATDDYLALNPTGKVPTLVDGDLSIWESHSILRYIAQKSKSDLYPADLAQRSKIDRWMDWLLASLNGAYVSIFKATKGGEPVPESSVAEMNASLKLLEAHLATNDYLAGDAFSLADVALGPIAHRCLGFPVDRPSTPNVSAWHERLAARPAFQKATGG